MTVAELIEELKREDLLKEIYFTAGTEPDANLRVTKIAKRGSVKLGDYILLS